MGPLAAGGFFCFILGDFAAFGAGEFSQVGNAFILPGSFQPGLFIILRSLTVIALSIIDNIVSFDVHNHTT
jgi:hypothetical protein